MDERSAILEEDATSTPPEEALEPTTPVDEPQPGSTEQVDPSPEDQPPAEPPKKETGWSKHKGKIIGTAAVILATLGGFLALALSHSENSDVADSSPSITPVVPEDPTYNKSGPFVPQECTDEITPDQNRSEVGTTSSNDGYTTIFKDIGMIVVNMPPNWRHSEEKKLQADDLGISLEPHQTLRNKHTHPYRVKAENRDSSTSDD